MEANAHLSMSILHLIQKNFVKGAYYIRKSWKGWEACEKVRACHHLVAVLASSHTRARTAGARVGRGGRPRAARRGRARVLRRGVLLLLHFACAGQPAVSRQIGAAPFCVKWGFLASAHHWPS